jgi:hypothetical protein
MEISNLPPLVIQEICKYLNTVECINLTRAIPELYDSVDSSNIWETVELCTDEGPFMSTVKDLKQVFSHAKKIRKLSLPYLEISTDTPVIDLLFFSSFGETDKLLHLDISGLYLSSLGFLYNHSSLTKLSIADCSHLIPEDFRILNRLSALEYLDVSFTAVTAEILIPVAPVLDSLVGDGVPFSFQNVTTFFLNHRNITFFSALGMNITGRQKADLRNQYEGPGVKLNISQF